MLQGLIRAMRPRVLAIPAAFALVIASPTAVSADIGMVETPADYVAESSDAEAYDLAGLPARTVAATELITLFSPTLGAGSVEENVADSRRGEVVRREVGEHGVGLRIGQQATELEFSTPRGNSFDVSVRGEESETAAGPRRNSQARGPVKAVQIRSDVTYLEGTHHGVDTFVQALPGGAVRSINAIYGPDSDHELEYEHRIPRSASIELTDDGGAVITYRNGETVPIPAPWAKDSRGEDVKSAYQLDDSGTLVLVVEPGEDAQYPLIADPCWSCIAVTVTATIAAGAVSGAVCAATAGVGCVAAVAAGGAVIGLTSYVSSTPQNEQSFAHASIATVGGALSAATGSYVSSVAANHLLGHGADDAARAAVEWAMEQAWDQAWNELFGK